MAGFMPFKKKDAGAKPGEKKLPPWLNKGAAKGAPAAPKKFADGGMVRRGYGKARGC